VGSVKWIPLGYTGTRSDEMLIGKIARYMVSYSREQVVYGRMLLAIE
jgi:hypothetical protein